MRNLYCRVFGHQFKRVERYRGGYDVMFRCTRCPKDWVPSGLCIDALTNKDTFLPYRIKETV